MVKSRETGGLVRKKKGGGVTTILKLLMWEGFQGELAKFNDPNSHYILKVFKILHVYSAQAIHAKNAGVRLRAFQFRRQLKIEAKGNSSRLAYLLLRSMNRERKDFDAIVL